MIDIKLIREDLKQIKKLLKRKGANLETIDKIADFDEKRRALIAQVGEMRAEQKLKSKEIKGTSEELLELKGKIKENEEILEVLEKDIEELLLSVPNLPLEEVPIGKDETENRVIRTVGEKPKFSFKPKEHWQLGEELDLIDSARGAKVAGERMSFIKNELVVLEFALIQFVLEKLINKGFTPMIPPFMVKERAMFGTGYFPDAVNGVYVINPGEDNLYPIGTSEVSLISYHDNEIIEGKSLPLLYCGYSPCFRREAGSYGKDTKGIFRLHQFEKVEMVIFCKPEESRRMHQFILSIEEEIMQDLGFHYQVVEMCTGDLGLVAAQKYDLEVWFPGQERYRELTSCSNCTDFQARRLNIRYKDETGNHFVHTLNGTGVAIGRTLAALIENYQHSDGSIGIPQILRPYAIKKL